MRLVRPEFSIEYFDPHQLDLIETAGRLCKKSDTTGDAAKFVKRITDMGHESVIEHSMMTVRFVVDRGVTHELVRHRLAAYSQESTRYCNYSKDDEIAVIEPFFFDPHEKRKRINIPEFTQGSQELEYGDHSYMMNSFDVWFVTCLWTQWGYLTLINEFKRTPQEARSVLPNSLKTEIVVTANFREWRHIFKLRCSSRSHPQMAEIMRPLRVHMQSVLPSIFGSDSQE